MTRRTLAASLLFLLIAAAMPGPALAGLRLGVVVPQDGPFAVLGASVRSGIDVYAAGHPAAFDEIVEETEACDAASGAEAAASMVEAEVDAVIGFLCPESLAAALPALGSARIVTITPAVRADIVMEEALRKSWPFFRLAPRAGAEAESAADTIAKAWSGEPFALVEDGTIYGRELVEGVRTRLESMGIRAAFIDNFRPAQDKQFGLARRLAKAGVTRVFIGGDRGDVAIIARDAEAIGLDLVFMGGDALNAPDGDVPLEDGVLAVLAPDPASRPEAAQALRAFSSARTIPEGYALPAYAAAEIIGSAGEKAAAGGATLAAAISAGRFDMALGPIAFGDDHEMDGDPFTLAIWRNGRFEPVDSVSDRAPAQPAASSGPN